MLQTRVFQTMGYNSKADHGSKENTWGKANISNSGKPTAMNLTIRSKGCIGPNPLGWGPCGGSGVPGSIHVLCSCICDMVLLSVGIQSCQDGIPGWAE